MIMMTDWLVCISTKETPRIKKVTLGNVNNAIGRHCEEPLRRSNPGAACCGPGLLRCARNDDGVDAAIIGIDWGVLAITKRATEGRQRWPAPNSPRRQAAGDIPTARLNSRLK